MNLDKIQRLVNSLTKSAENNEKLFTTVLASKLEKATQTYPGDQTLGAMLRVISKMASNKVDTINRGELRALYNKLYSRNTKFADLFQNELGKVENLKGAKLYPHDESTGEISSYQMKDRVLVAALESAFDKQVPVKMYAQAAAQQAQKLVCAALDAWNMKPSSVQIADGNDKFLVIKADYETPKGVTSFHVPVEIRNGKIVEAEVFVGNAGVQEINHANLKGYLTSQAGNKLRMTGLTVLQALTAVTSESREISAADLALSRLNAVREGKTEFSTNQVIGQKIAEATVQDVQLPKSEEFTSFEQQFTSPHGQAAWQFGDNMVRTAREHITRQLKSFGHQNPQVVVKSSDAQGISYGVALNAGRIGFIVPVKVANGKINQPNVIVCNGSIHSFTQEGVSKLCEQECSDIKTAAVASPQFGLTSGELLTNIKTAMIANNHAAAEDALNVLANGSDKQIYALALRTFMDGLMPTQAAKETQCSKMIKNSTSQHSICSHTGLPVNKVYQDKEGNCRPLYRQNMDETYQAAYLNNCKVLG